MCVIWKVGLEWKMPIFFIKNIANQNGNDAATIHKIKEHKLSTLTKDIHNLTAGKTFGVGLHNSYGKIEGPRIESYDVSYKTLKKNDISMSNYINEKCTFV